ncbi:hypothetical protein E2C01_031535 [Portunus trituberculatus]|uniref:Uncharacterized protein n=1 Tax=Portunus trituberculatus TaxID=210409 RepID=A0A5B7F0B7_PORTR|nr:hypothetical protein [Portunus trituberculatus]
MSLLLTSAPLLQTDVFNKVRRITGKYSAPSQPILLSAGRTVADPMTVADLFVEHFASVSQKDPAAPGARHRQRMESLGVNFSSTGGESYNVPFCVFELQTALSQCHDSFPGLDDIPYALLRHMLVPPPPKSPTPPRLRTTDLQCENINDHLLLLVMNEMHFPGKAAVQQAVFRSLPVVPAPVEVEGIQHILVTQAATKKMRQV